MGRRVVSAYEAAVEEVAVPRQAQRVWSIPRGRVQSVALLSVVLAAIFVYGLNTLPLGSLNEGLYAECARKMVETGQWLNPRINTIAYWEKPPLLYWAVALSMRTFGYGELAARLPSALALVGTCLMTFLFAKRLYDRRIAWLSLAILATAPYFIMQQQTVMFDGLLSFFFAGAVYAFCLGRLDRRWYLAAAAALGLAVMTKGFVALFLFVPVVVLYRWLSHKPLNLGYAAWAAPAVFLAIIAPWHVYESVTQPGFAWFYFVNEHFLRFLGRKVPADFQTGNCYEPLLRSMLLMLPWGIFLIPSAISALRHRQSDLLPLLWFAVPLVFFSVSTAKSNYYMVIAAPAMAMMLALFLQRNRYSAWLPGGLAVLGLLGLAAMWKFGMKTPDNAFQAMRGAVTWYALALLVIAALLSAWLLRLRQHTHAVWAMCSLLLLLRLSMFHTGAPLTPWISEKAVAVPLATMLLRASQTPQVIMDGRLENHSSFIFYLPPQARPLLVAQGRWGDLWYGSFREGQDRLFISRERAWELVNANRAVYCLETKRVPAGANIVCRAGYMTVVAGPRLARSLLQGEVLAQRK